MKKSILLAAIFAFIGMNAGAQKCMVVNSEKIFKSIAAYNDANTALDEMGQKYQSNVDDAYARVERLYNDYMKEKPYLSENARQIREDAILKIEQEAIDYQEKVFGQDGEFMKKRVEMIKPIQDRVFSQVDRYAEANGYDLVLDIYNNPMVLHYSRAADKTDAIINLVK